MGAMKAMKKKVVSARLAKRHAFFGKIAKTNGGLVKTALVKNKNGWIAAVQKARSVLKIKGFSPIKKGTPLYKKAKGSTASEYCNRARGEPVMESTSSGRGDFYACRAPELSLAPLVVTDEGCN